MTQQPRWLSPRRVGTLLLLGIGIVLLGYFNRPVHVVHVGVKVLRGVTAERMPFELGLSDGLVRGLTTRLTAHCDNGSSWTATWSPVEGDPVHFVPAGEAFSTSQRWEHAYANGVFGDGGFVLKGRMTGRASAQGTVRLRVRFDYGSSSSSCDSRAISWSAGAGGSPRVRPDPAPTLTTAGDWSVRMHGGA